MSKRTRPQPGAKPKEPQNARRDGPVTPESGSRPRRLPRVARHGVVILLVAACLWCWHPVILRGIARLLIVDQPQSPADYIWIRTEDGIHADGDRCYERAAALYHQDRSRRILLMEPYPCRVVRTGAVPCFEQISRRALEARRVPGEAVEVIGGSPRTLWQEARLLQAWLNKHPDAKVLLLCSRFAGRRWRYVLDTVLGADGAAKVALFAPPDRRYNETDWWKSRRGAKDLYYWALYLAYTWCQGERPAPLNPWNPDDYERSLRQTIREG